MIEYPKCLYRYPAQSSQTVDLEGVTFEWRIVPDENAELSAIPEGWALVPTIPIAELTAPTEPATEPVKVKKGKHK